MPKKGSSNLLELSIDFQCGKGYLLKDITVWHPRSVDLDSGRGYFSRGELSLPINESVEYLECNVFKNNKLCKDRAYMFFQVDKYI